MSKNFEELLKALQDTADQADGTSTTLAKADAGGDEKNPEDDDATIAAAAAAAATKAAEGAKDGDGAAKDDKGGDGKPVFGKSMTAVDADGNAVDAVDATELVKSLVARQETTEGNLTKALGTVLGALQKQGELVKSLADKVTELSSQGRGRKTMLTINEKPDTATLAKANSQGEPQLTWETLMAKANTAFDGGKITGKELTVLDVCRRSGQMPEAGLVQKILPSA